MTEIMKVEMKMNLIFDNESWNLLSWNENVTES